jgi:glycosyltransferase involved in cell wall biosynthesis
MESMDKPEKILIINPAQYGYHIDTLMYCRYADKNKFSISYLCFDTGLEKIPDDGIKVRYVNLTGNRLASYFRFFSSLHDLVSSEKFDLIFHVDARFTILIRLLHLRKRMVLDIRTGNLSGNSIKRKLLNYKIWLSACLYPSVSVITDSLRKTIGIPAKKAAIIPLGGEAREHPALDFSSLRLVYLGTLQKRDIYKTVEGLAIFSKKYPGVSLSYDIIGSGRKETEERLVDSIKSSGLENVITFHGRLMHDRAIEKLALCNVGVVYIPCTGYYDVQSSTKFYEYVLAGIPVIATNTYENRLALKEGCGFLCNDSAGSFSAALEQIYKSREGFSQEKIRNSYSDSEWSYIVRNIWEPFILRNCLMSPVGESQNL